MRISDWSSDVCSSDLWAAKRAERHNERFTAMDTDKNGQISKAEFDAAHAARAEKWGDSKRGDRKLMRGHPMGHGEMRGDMRSEERRVGQECVRKRRSRVGRYL